MERLRAGLPDGGPLRGAHSVNAMKCFNHREIDAIAVCKHCGRALCPNCAAEVELAAACKGRCEVEVAAILDAHERAKTAYQKVAATTVRSAVFIGMLGFVFAILGIFGWGKGGGFSLIMGTIFLLWSAFSFNSAKRYRNRD